MVTFTVRQGSSNAPKAAASIETVQWNGVGLPPAEMAGSTALSTAFACLLITVLDDRGTPVPNPEVTIIFSKLAAPIVENASAVGTGSGGFPTGFGANAEGIITAGYFGGVAGIGVNAAVGAQAMLTHIVTGNAFGQVALKFAAAPAATLDATAIHVRCGSAGIRLTDLTGLTTNP